MNNGRLIQQRRQHGFTLLEVMLVFLLMAMVSVGVMMTLPNTANSQQGVTWQTQRFSTLVQFAQDEALISGLQLGLVFTTSSYQFAVYDHESRRWSALAVKQLQNKVELPDNLSLSYSLSGIMWDELDTQDQDSFISQDDLVFIEGQQEAEELLPQIYLMSSGEVTPFAVTFSATDNSEALTVSVGTTGDISVGEEQ